LHCSPAASKVELLACQQFGNTHWHLPAVGLAE
jgi:hypothetical protein